MNAAARDLRHGRQGGGWQETTARQALAAIARARTAAGDDWPAINTRSTVFDPATATVADWDGLARMAHARRSAGHPLDELDLEALDHYPTCPPLLQETSP